MSDILELTWDQVHLNWIRKQFLEEKAKPERLEEVVSTLCGLHAQVASSAEISLWARVEGIGRSDVRDSLYNKRTLLKLWAMRGTLHLIPSSELGLYLPPLRESVSRSPFMDYFLRENNLTREDIESMKEAIRIALGQEGITRKEIAERTADLTGIESFRKLLLSGWGGGIQYANYDGILSFGEPSGNTVKFVNPMKWLHEKGIEPGVEYPPSEALRKIALRFIRTYGPTNPGEFGRWFGLNIVPSRNLFNSLSDELVEVSIDGYRGFMIKGSTHEMDENKAEGRVTLLPAFDQYVYTLHKRYREMVLKKHRDDIYREAGWISPTILLDGKIIGTWEYRINGNGLKTGVKFFRKQNGAVRKRIDEKIESLRDFISS